MAKSLGIATRFYGFAKGDTERLATWVDAALKIVSPEHIYIAIRTEVDKSGSLAYMRKYYPKVNTFAVMPWGRVVQAPNALLLKAAENRESHLLFASSEYPVTKASVQLLFSHNDKDTLVVGSNLEGHDFQAKKGRTVVVRHSNGLQIPWNTYALWSVAHLVHTGFVLTADSAHDQNNAGMEEMGTIAAQQILWPNKAKAKLVNSHDATHVRNTRGWTVARYERYAHNLESKRSRSAAQMARLSLATPKVIHIG